MFEKGCKIYSNLDNKPLSFATYKIPFQKLVNNIKGITKSKVSLETFKITSFVSVNVPFKKDTIKDTKIIHNQILLIAHLIGSVCFIIRIGC